jgi:dephospho-CoA kinase
MAKKKGNFVKARRIIFSRSSLISLLEIEKYIAENLASPLNAIKVIEAIHSKVERISKCPTA